MQQPGHNHRNARGTAGEKTSDPDSMNAETHASVPPTSLDGLRMPPPSKPSVMDHVIPAKNMPALLGYYFGVFSLLPVLGLLLGPAAVISGVLGLRKARPTGVGRGHAITAIVLGGLFGGVQWLVAVFMAVAMVRYRQTMGF
jgi:hypothetical protein